MAGERLYPICSAINAIYNTSSSAITYDLPTGGTGLHRVYVPNSCWFFAATASASFNTNSSTSAGIFHGAGAFLASCSGMTKFCVLAQNAGTFTLNVVAFASVV